MTRKVQRRLAEMSDAAVDFISLVHAGANSQPFKRLKSDEGGRDVISFGSKKDVFKVVREQPVLVALAVDKDGGDVEAARLIAKAAGIEIAEERETDEATLLLPNGGQRVNTDAPDQVVVRLDEKLAAVCGVSKMFTPFNGQTSFAEAVKGQGFFPQLGMALETFAEVSRNIMSESEDPNAAAEKVQKAAAEFGDFVTGLARALPAEVFKLDATLKAAGVEKRKADGDGDEECWECRHKEDISACMRSPHVRSSFPDQEQRAAYCYSAVRGGKRSFKKEDGAVELTPVEASIIVDGVEGIDGEAKVEKAADGKTVLKIGEISITMRVSEGSPGSPGVVPAKEEAEFASGDGIDSKGSAVASKEGEAAPEAPAGDEPPAWAKTLTESVNAQAAAVQEQVAGLAKKVDEAVEQAGEARKKAEGADAALRGRVASSEQDEPTPRAKSMRGHSAGGPPLMDTGMGRM